MTRGDRICPVSGPVAAGVTLGRESSLPLSKVEEDLRGTLEQLSGLEGADRFTNTFSTKRISLALEALRLAEDHHRIGLIGENSGPQTSKALLEAVYRSAYGIFLELQTVPESLPRSRIELCSILADKLATVSAQYLEPDEAKRKVGDVAKDLLSVLELGELTKIDELPSRIQSAPNLSALARFGLWGVLSAYCSVLWAKDKASQSGYQASNAHWHRVAAARDLANDPPRELALLRSSGNGIEESAPFQVASEILLQSACAAAHDARTKEIFLRAEGIAKLVYPFIDRLGVSQLRYWLRDCALTCQQAQQQRELGHATRMWRKLEAIAGWAGEPLLVEAIHFSARGIESEVELGRSEAAKRAIDLFWQRVAALPEERWNEVHFDAMRVERAAVSLLLKRAIRFETTPQVAEGLLLIAEESLEAQSSTVEGRPSSADFMRAESFLDLAEAYIARWDLGGFLAVARGLWERARRVIEETERHCTDGVLYMRIVSRTRLAEISMYFDDRSIHISQRDEMEKLRPCISAALQFEDLQGDERRSFQYAHLEFLRELGRLQSSGHDGAAEYGAQTMRQALQLYEQYAVVDANKALRSSLLRVAVDVFRKNDNHEEAFKWKRILDWLAP
jgi:hypothetical protein